MAERPRYYPNAKSLEDRAQKLERVKGLVQTIYQNLGGDQGPTGLNIINPQILPEGAMERVAEIVRRGTKVAQVREYGETKKIPYINSQIDQTTAEIKRVEELIHQGIPTLRGLSAFLRPEEIAAIEAQLRLVTPDVTLTAAPSVPEGAPSVPPTPVSPGIQEGATAENETRPTHKIVVNLIEDKKSVDGRDFDLKSPIQNATFMQLARNPGKDFTEAELTEIAKKAESKNPRAGGMMVFYLRKTLEPDPKNPTILIKTENGYQLDAEVEIIEKNEKKPSISKQEEELIQREQIFTPTQATIIATTILHKDGVSFITPNNTVLYTFTIGDDVRPILSEIASLPVNQEYQDLSDQQRLELRNSTLSELDSLLGNHSLLNQAYEENKFGQNLQELLIWLSEQNDAVGGKLCELLTLQVLQDIVIDTRRLDMLGNQKYARLPGELARYIRMASNLGVSSKPKQEEKMPGIPSNPPVVVSALSHEQPAKPKTFDIERRDPQIRELISEYIRLIAENNITKPVSGAQVSYFFPRIKKTDLEKALERKYISPERGRELFPVYGPKEILILLYIRNHGNNLTARHIKDLQDMVEEELSKQGKPQG